jgi:hypothetical protein
MPRSLARLFRAFLWTATTLLVLWAALIKGPMFLTRWRMQRLLTDFHSVYPTQSTWPDAQRLMTSWGKWGHHDGSCNAVDCDYDILISDPYSSRLSKLSERMLGRLIYLHFFTFMEHLGWRDTLFSVRFVVQDGKIVRTRTVLRLEVADSGPPEHWQYSLGFVSQVRSRLKRSSFSEHEAWILGSDEQLDDHPDYKVGRPGGCENCENAELTYTDTLPHSDLARLTAYDLSCLTRFHPCTQTGDLLPAGRDWHLYDGDTMGPVGKASLIPVPCRTEARALGRDAEDILEVEASSVETREDTAYIDTPITVELAHAHLLRVLKGRIDAPLGSQILISPFSGSKYQQPNELAEHLTPGHRYLVLVDSTHRLSQGELEADRCGVLDDTPANLRAIQTGIGQDVGYRHPIQFGE